MLKNTENSWGWGAQALHWLVFIIFTSLLFIGDQMKDLKADEALWGIGKYSLYDYHKSFGLILLFIVFIRISWRMANITPETAPLTKFEKGASHFVHYLLYIAMLVMPISGYVMSMAGGYGIKFFGNPEWMVPNIVGLNKAWAGFAHEAHEYAALAVYVILSIHILAALYHHFYKKDNVLKAMLYNVNKKH